MPHSTHTCTSYVGVLLCAVLALSPLSAYASFSSYSRVPSGTTLYYGDSIDFTVTASGESIGNYVCFFIGSVPITPSHLLGSDPDTFTLSNSDLAIGSYTEVFAVVYHNSDCTSYVSASSVEYDGGATIFEVVDAPTPPAPDVATSTPDSYPEILAFSFFLAFAGFVFPFLIANYIDRGY